MVDEKTFYQQYGSLVSKAWSDRAFLDELKTNPQAALASEGIQVKAGARIEVQEIAPTGTGKFEDQLQKWNEGEKTGSYVLWIPEPPAAVAGARAAAGDVNTTCTPCCCCT